MKLTAAAIAAGALLIPGVLFAQDAPKPPETKAIDAALTRSLTWLAAHQSADGSWSSATWRDECQGHRCAGPGHDAGKEQYDVGVTALAARAFLAAGFRPDKGPHRKVLSRALDWLSGQQDQRGAVGVKKGEDIYNHALATLTLVEASDFDKDLRAVATDAVDYCLVAQNPGLGWKYGVKPGNNDTSVTGCMVLALEAAKRRGFKVPKSSFQGAVNWFRRATSARGAAGYSRAGGGSSYMPAQKGQFDEVPAMTAVAIVGRLACGESADDPLIQSGLKLLAGTRPSWKAAPNSKINFYYWHFGARAHALVAERSQGLIEKLGSAKQAEAWLAEAAAVLLAHQRTKGKAAGSWDGVGEWCLVGGRVYATAIAAITLAETRKGAEKQ